MKGMVEEYEEVGSQSVNSTLSGPVNTFSRSLTLSILSLSRYSLSILSLDALSRYFLSMLSLDALSRYSLSMLSTMLSNDALSLDTLCLCRCFQARSMSRKERKNKATRVSRKRVRVSRVSRGFREYQERVSRVSRESIKRVTKRSILEDTRSTSN